MMNRRSFIKGATALSTVSIIVGCNSQIADNDNKEENTEEKQELDYEGQPIPIANVIDIESVSDDNSTIRLYLRAHRQSFDINVHRTKLTDSQWVLRNNYADMHPNNPMDNENEYNKDYRQDNRKNVELETKNTNLIESFEFDSIDTQKQKPEKIYADKYDSIDPLPTNDGAVWDITIENDTIEYGETFIYEFIIEDKLNNEKYRETSTYPILKTEDNGYIYPDVSEDKKEVSKDIIGRDVVKSKVPKWNERVVSNNKINNNKNEIVRVTSTSRYKEFDRNHDIVTSPESVNNLTFNSPFMKPWSVQYNITNTEINNINGDRLISDRSSNNPRDEVDLLTIYNDENHVNNEIIKRVGDKLYNKCQKIGYTEDFEKIRFLTDFVQGMEYEIKDLVTPAQTFKEMKGDCKHGSVLLYSLLKHEKFDYEPLIVGTNYDTGVSDVDGHVGVAIHKDEFNYDYNIVNEYSNYFDDDSGDITNSDYIYIETTELLPFNYMLFGNVEEFQDINYLWG